jgi:hypothetical protein
MVENQFLYVDMDDRIEHFQEHKIRTKIILKIINEKVNDTAYFYITNPKNFYNRRKTTIMNVINFAGTIKSENL